MAFYLDNKSRNGKLGNSTVVCSANRSHYQGRDCGYCIFTLSVRADFDGDNFPSDTKVKNQENKTSRIL